LFNNKGVLKVCDFGLARYFGDPLPLVPSHRVAPFTTVVVTLWYRAPELLLADPRGVISYGTEIDVWSIGCILGEMLVLKPMFAGPKEEIDFLAGVLKVTGAPTEENWPGVTKLPYWQKLNACPNFNPRARPSWEDYNFHLTPSGSDLLRSLLCLNPAERISASKAKEHAWFTEAPVKCPKEALPKWTDSNAETHDLRRRIRSDEGVAMGSHVGVKVNAKKYLEDWRTRPRSRRRAPWKSGRPIGRRMRVSLSGRFPLAGSSGRAGAPAKSTTSMSKRSRPNGTAPPSRQRERPARNGKARQGALRCRLLPFP